MKTLEQRLARGEQAAFAELYDACADRLHHYLTLRLGSRVDADDVLQNTFVRLAQARSRLTQVQNVVAYLFQIARNESADFLARKGKEACFIEQQSCELLFQPTSAHPATAWESAEYVAQILARLTPEQREIIDLKIYGTFTFQEIAEIMDIPPGTAATRYRAALERMQEWCRRELS